MLHSSGEMEKRSVLERDLLSMISIDASGIKGLGQSCHLLCQEDMGGSHQKLRYSKRLGSQPSFPWIKVGEIEVPLSHMIEYITMN